MQPTVLLTLGRLPKALTLARMLNGAGWRVIVAEPFRWHIARASRAVARSYRITAPNTDPETYRRELLDIIRKERVQLVIPVSEEILHVAPLHGHLPRGVTLVAPSVAVLAELHDKYRFALAARASSLAAPESATADSDTALALARSGPTVMKPRRGCSGQGVVHNSAGTVPSHHSEDWLVQRRIEGETVCSLSFVREGSPVFTVCYRGIAFAGSVAVAFERIDADAALRDWVATFCRGRDVEGFLAFDFIVDGRGIPWAIECNPRLTSGIHFLDPAAVAEMLTEGYTLAPAFVRAAPRRWQWFYSTLTEVYANLFRPRRMLACASALLRCRDTVMAWRDPLPFLLMTPLSWEILWPAIREGISLGEATQRDIAWLWHEPVTGGSHGI